MAKTQSRRDAFRALLTPAQKRQMTQNQGRYVDVVGSDGGEYRIFMAGASVSNVEVRKQPEFYKGRSKLAPYLICSMVGGGTRYARNYWDSAEFTEDWMYVQYLAQLAMILTNEKQFRRTSIPRCYPS